MTESAAFFRGLVGAILLAIRCGPELTRTALALLANWVGCTAAVMVTGDNTPWLFFLAIDALTAAFVLWKASSRAAVVIGVLYIWPITLHVAYALVDNSAAAWQYITMLTASGWLQMAALAIGVLHDGARKRRAATHCLGSDLTLHPQARARGVGPQ